VTAVTPRDNGLRSSPLAQFRAFWQRGPGHIETRKRDRGRMDFDLTERQAFYRDRVKAFIETRIRPRHADYKTQLNEGDRWQPIPVIEELKPAAREAGLWNMR
jgi:hypothetical protein